MGEGSGALKIHSRADAANRVAVYGVRHVTVSPRSYIVWRTEVVQRFLIKETRPLEAFALRGLFCWGDIMKCSFDSTGTLGTLYEAAVVFVAMSVSLFLISIGDYYRFSTLMAVSAIIFTVSAAAAFVLYIIKGGMIYAKSDKLIITHSLASRKILVSRISYEDIEYADHDDADHDQRDHDVMLPGELFLQENAAPEDGRGAVGRDDGGRERNVRLVGQRVDIRKLPRRLEQRTRILGRFGLEDELVLFDHNNINKADHGGGEERQLIRAVGRILIERAQDERIGERARRVQQAVGHRQTQRQPGFCVFVVGALLPLFAQLVVLPRLDDAEADHADAHQRHRADDHPAHRARDRLVQRAGDEAQDRHESAGGIADRRRDRKLNVPQAHIAQRHRADVQQRHRQIRPHHVPRDDRAAHEDLIRRVDAHHDADGDDHLEGIILVPPVAAADLGK